MEEGATDESRTGPLAGLRVVDFSHIAAGPYGTLQLAYFGAEVIKVESKKRPDGWRVRDGNSHLEASRPFADHNKNKLDITVDLKTPSGLELVRRLIARSDVVVENFSFGVMDRLGLDYPTLRSVKPDLIVVSIPGLGSTGPRRDWVTWGPSLMPLTGLSDSWRHPDDEEPVGSQTSYPDYVVGAHVPALILAAVAARDRTGRGVLIDVSQAELTATLIAPAFVEYLANGRGPGPLGNTHPIWVPYGCYPCAGDDAWCFVACTDDAAWAGICRVLDRPEWAVAEEYSTFEGRRERRDEIDRAIAAWTELRPPRQVMERLQEESVPAGIVATGSDLLEDPQLRHRDFLVDTKHPFLPGLRLPGIPIALSKTPGRIARHAPLLGQDNLFVVKGLLGMSDADYESLTTSGALG